MLVLISIAIAVSGLYIATASHLEAGITLTASGLFSLFLALQISDLKDRLSWAKAENEKLSKKAAKSSPSVSDVPKVDRKSPKAVDPKHQIPEPPVDFYDDPESIPEEVIRVDPDPAPARLAAPVATAEPPRIVTRTSRSSGGYTQETWKGERTWSRNEVDELIELYSDGDVLDSIAIKMRLDKKDVVYKLTRLNFGDSGDLEDLSEAPNDGKAWSKEDSKKLLEMNTAGITLSGMAKTFGRTKLAIGWRLADQRKLTKIQ
jgi:hypothetical protein